VPDPSVQPPEGRLRDDDMVLVPRDALTAAAGELRAWSGHWASALSSLSEIVEHDRRMKDGSCCTCALLAVLDEYAGQRGLPAGTGEVAPPAGDEINT
jgi:hypothetical protein